MELLARAERAMAQPRQRSRRSSTVNTARYLERLLRPEAASITLINRENYWVYQPMLPEQAVIDRPGGPLPESYIAGIMPLDRSY